MMTTQELNERATARAVAERLHTFKVAGQAIYLVRSRETEPGAMHQVHVTAGAVDRCSCRGWGFRQSCTHAAAVTRRLQREHKASPVTDEPVMDTAPTTRHQIYREA
jgi:hypothetical protein